MFLSDVGSFHSVEVYCTVSYGVEMWCSVPVRFWCTLRTVCRTLGSSPGTAGDTRGASSPQLQYCPPSPPGPEKQ